MGFRVEVVFAAIVLGILRLRAAPLSLELQFPRMCGVWLRVAQGFGGVGFGAWTSMGVSENRGPKY